VSPGVKRTAVALALVLAIALAARPARAHPEPASTLVNRYITLWVGPQRLDVQYSLLYGELTAPELRRQIDRDGDGALTGSEVDAYARGLAEGVDRMLTLRLDGRPLPLRALGRVDLNGKPAVAAAPVVLELTASAPLPPGERRVEVLPGPALPRLGDTEIALELGGGWALVSSEPPPGSPGRGQPRFQLPHGHGAGGAPGPAVFVIRSGAPAPATVGDLALPLLLSLVVGAAALAIGLWFARRSRQRR
jgi:hypothetical protein